MKRIIFFIFALAAQSLAGGDAQLVLATREYRVPYSFITWIEDAASPQPPTPSADRPGIPAILCYRMTLGTTNHWPAGASATHIGAGNRLIVRHTPPFLKALDQLAAQWRQHGGKRPPHPRLLQILREQCPSPAKQ